MYSYSSAGYNMNNNMKTQRNVIFLFKIDMREPCAYTPPPLISLNNYIYVGTIPFLNKQMLKIIEKNNFLHSTLLMCSCISQILFLWRVDVRQAVCCCANSALQLNALSSIVLFRFLFSFIIIKINKIMLTVCQPTPSLQY